MSGTQSAPGYGGLSAGFGLRIDPLTGKPVTSTPGQGFSPLAGLVGPDGQPMAAPNLQLAPMQAAPQPAQAAPMGAPMAAETAGMIDGPPAMPSAEFMQRGAAQAEAPPWAPPGQTSLDYVGAKGLGDTSAAIMATPTPAQPTPPTAPAAPVTDPAAFAKLDNVPAPAGLDKSRLDGLWTKITAGESGGTADPTRAKNPKSSAYGAAQFIDSTRDNFLSSPEAKAAGYTVESFKKDPAVQRAAFDWLTRSNDRILSAYTNGAPVPDDALEAAHALGAGGVIALMRQPNANALKAYGETVGGDPAKTLITNNPAWGITKDDTANDALHKIAAYYNNRGKAAPGASTPASQTTPAAPEGGPKAPEATPTDSTGSPFDDPAKSVGAASFDPMAQLASYRPVQTSDKMLAAAGGILQGGGGLNGLTKGLGMGLERAQALGVTDQNNRFKIAQEAAQTQLLKQRLGLVEAQTNAAAAKPGQADRALDLKDDANEIARQRAAAMTTNSQVAAGRLELGNRAQSYRESGGQAEQTLRAKDNQTVTNTISTGQESAGKEMELVANLRNVLKSDPGVVGADAKSRMQRFFADNLGLDVGVNPDANSLGAKLVAELNNEHALGNAKAMLGRVTQGEAMFLKQSAANIGTRPEAFQAFLGDYERLAKNRLALSDQFRTLASDPAAYRAAANQPRGLRGWMDDRLNEQLQAQGVNANGPAPPTLDKGPDGNWQHVEVPGVNGGVRVRINGATPTH